MSTTKTKGNQMPDQQPIQSAPPAPSDQPVPTTTRRRRIVRRRTTKKSANTTTIPPHLAPDTNPLLSQAISALPVDYSFEIPKALHRISIEKPSHVALQLPEGLLLYGTTLADILQKFSPCVETVSILGDVTYGACCVDDLGAKALGVDLLLHYGHSCLVPITKSAVKCMYIFVEIRVDVEHCVDCVCATIEEGVRVEVMGTVQFRSAVEKAAILLTEKRRGATVPQCKPLSRGEVLGCTAPTIITEEGEDKVMLFLADGRFHLEAAMIANPTLKAYRYDPYGKTLTEETYGHDQMLRIRRNAMSVAKHAQTFGIVLGTLGRQGNPSILAKIRKICQLKKKSSFIILLSEIFPEKLNGMPQADAWVQVACPRLSVDWGHYFDKPLLNSYEFFKIMEDVEDDKPEDHYPMDYYGYHAGEWGNYHEKNRDRVM